MAYILVTVCERDIAVQQFETLEAARAQMMCELEDEFYESDYFPNDDGEMWNRIASHAVFREYECEDDGFAFGDTWAWSNLDSSHNFDWKIVQLA